MIAPKEDAVLWESLRERAGRMSNVLFMERVPYREVQQWYDRAHVFVNTSTWEGFANAFIQAGQGEAAILSLAVNTDQLLTRFGAGLCAEDDQRAFIEAARALFREPAKRREMQLGAARFVAEWHDNDRNVDAFLGGLPK
jgi:glycosyltransferase involved in cell wall biosynthesis